MQLLAQEVTRLHSELRSACQQQLPAHTAPPPLLSHKQGSNLSCNPESANKAMIKGRRWCVSGAWGKGRPCCQLQPGVCAGQGAAPLALTLGLRSHYICRISSCSWAAEGSESQEVTLLSNR